MYTHILILDTMYVLYMRNGVIAIGMYRNYAIQNIFVLCLELQSLHMVASSSIVKDAHQVLQVTQEVKIEMLSR